MKQTINLFFPVVFACLLIMFIRPTAMPLGQISNAEKELDCKRNLNMDDGGVISAF